MRVRTLVLVSAAALALSGCAAPIVAGLTLSQLSTIAGVISTATTGKGLSDHALSWITGKDCSITEGLLRSDRDICEPKGSLATQEDFKGVFAYLDRKSHEGDPGDKALQRYAAAREGEIAKSEGADQPPAETVIEANATGLNLRRLLDDMDFLEDTGSGQPSTPVATASATPVDDPHVSMITYRDSDRDGTPRIVERHVYMMAPIPDSPATATAMATPATPAPVTAPVMAPVVSAAPAPQPAPVVQAQPAPQPAPVVAAQPAPQPPPAPQVVAAAKPAVAATPAAYVKPAKKGEATQEPQPLVHWYLSGR